MRPLKIAINARILATDSLRGWSRYTYNLLTEFAKTEHHILLMSDKKINPNLVPQSVNITEVIECSSPYVLWEQYTLPRLCQKNQTDILHCPTNYGLPLFCSAKKILTLHDAIEKSFYDPRKSFQEKISLNHLKIRGLHYASQWSADQIITVSQHAKEDIHKTYGVAKEKISVIYEAADPLFAINSILPFERLTQIVPQLKPNYYFYIGGLEDRKNISFLIDTMSSRKSTSEQTLIAGGSAELVDHYKNIVERAGLSQRIFFIGITEDALLPSLYHYSHCFIYPSFYEGFGLQVVESLQMDKPVLCANTTSLVEVLGDSECGFSPYSTLELSALIDRMNIPEFYQKKKVFAQNRKKDFNWKKTAQETLALYHQVLES